MTRLFDLHATHTTDPEVQRWWATKAPPLSALARTWWDVMKGCGSDVRESLHDGNPAACLDVYPFAYVAAFSKHVNVGFYYGSLLDDPLGLLLGSGKRMRHVKLLPGEAFDTDGLAALIHVAHADLAQRIEADD